MPSFEEHWREAKRYRIEDFKSFGLVNGQLWAPAYIKEKWRILELDVDVAWKGAMGVFTLKSDTNNIVPLIKTALRGDRKACG